MTSKRKRKIGWFSSRTIQAMLLIITSSLHSEFLLTRHQPALWNPILMMFELKTLLVVLELTKIGKQASTLLRAGRKLMVESSL